MRWFTVIMCVAAVSCTACAGSMSSATPNDKNICKSWVETATAVNRGAAAGQRATLSDPSEVARLLADPAYAGDFQAVGALADSANDSALRDATTTLRSSIQATANHTSVDPAALVNAMSTLTRRCHDFGFVAQAVASH